MGKVVVVVRGMGKSGCVDQRLHFPVLNWMCVATPEDRCVTPNLGKERAMSITLKNMKG